MRRQVKSKSRRRTLTNSARGKTVSSAQRNLLFNQAVALHQQGRLNEAQEMYQHVLEGEPTNQLAVLNLAIVYQQTQRDVLARQALERGVSAAPNDPVAHYNLGNFLRRFGDLHDAAEAAFAEALRLQPDFADAHYALGTLKHDRSDLTGAERCYRAALRLESGAARYWNSLGTALLDQSDLDQGNLDEAISCFRQAIRQQHDYAIAYLSLGSAYRDKGQQREEIEAYLEGLKIRTDIPELHNNLAAAWRESGEFEMAIESALEAINRRPNYANAYFNLAHSYLSLDRVDAAERAFKSCLQYAPQHVGAHSGLGSVYLALNKVEQSIVWQRRAIKLDAKAAGAHSSLGMALLSMGEAGAAQESLLEALRLEPSFPAAWFSLSKSRRFGAADDALVAEAEASLNNPSVSQLGRMNLHFALGKMHDDRKCNVKAFEHYEQANRTKRATVQFDRGDFSATIEGNCDVFTTEYFSRRAQHGDSSQLPIFILGLNRSGTTLVEQIISSHPEVFGAGELIRIPEQIETLPSELGSIERYPACMNSIDADHIQRFAADYLTHLRSYSADSRRITDKLPGNFLHIGWISTLFPQARIIHCRRDAMDVCLSNYTQLFSQGNYFSYDLDDLGFYYCGYERLMDHWRAVIPNPFYEIQYEELVARQEQRSRELIEFCGLSWHEDCLAFFANQRVVNTASHWQVRQPMYRSSVARWKRYERQLAPLRAALARYKE